MVVVTQAERAFWEKMSQTIGDAAAKWWLGIAGVLTAAGILWGASFAFQSSLALQHLNDQQATMQGTITQIQNDVNDIKHRLDARP